MLETDERSASGSSRVRSCGASPSLRNDQEAVGHFKECIARIRPAVEIVLDAFRAMNAADEINLDFGIKFNSKVGAINASADRGATFKVSLKWKSQS